MYVEHLRIPVGVGALHAERVGRGGPPVLLLHGFGTCAFLWRQLAPQLASAGYTAIALDLLGHGESDRPSDAAFTLDAQAEHVIRAVAALRLPDMAVIGQDIGALVALELAASPRSRVTSLALLSPPDPDELPGVDVRAMQRNAALLALSSNTLFGALPALAPLLRAAVADPSLMPERLIARYLAPFVGPDGLNQLLQRAAAVEWSAQARDRLRAVAVPVLVLDGAEDPPRQSLDWASVLPQATIATERLAGASRLLPEETPTALKERILRWLDGQRKS